ncbi:baseplate J-like protein [Synechococcus phage S-CBWM1]|uniref:Baseplate J-like protein n=1 Tax=Synechococcus phage S-CBWM1 TaxID=2053653 RepID=A0A3G1L3V3_9CAUD|nr:baseplate J-like protein [Synechococcus phage S-CBWM1]ATW62862.1 baseplate J-like protein [Synechococcus phage S-CBWM1]
MPRYAPLPAVSIDPRNEAQLVKEAAQRIYEASNGNLNDFSAGNPLSALLEGHAYAANEFLYWADQLPDKILIDWIGPFLGAMRRLGTPAVALLKLNFPPRTTPLFIPSGTEFSSDPNKTGGESLVFISTQDYTISPGDLSVSISVSSKYIGVKYNIPANTITSISSSGVISGATVTNPQPAAGGSDVETYEEVQERFLTLIRRRNPVSQFDWQEFFIDLFGLGTVTIVRPNQSERAGYNYELDQRAGNTRGGISFFVLGPGGVELSQEQINRAQRVLNFSVPVNLTPHLFPITLDEAHVKISLEVEEAGVYASDYKSASRNFRDKLFSILVPGGVFPVNSTPSVSDIEAAFNSSIQTEMRFKDPRVLGTTVYNTPVALTESTATHPQIYEFRVRENLLEEKDLVVVNDPNPIFYPVVAAFSPYSTKKGDQAQLENLSLKKIRSLEAGQYKKGDIVYYPSDTEEGLRVILENMTIPSSTKIPALIANGRISGLKTYSDWSSGNSYSIEDGGKYSPEIILYDYSEGEFIPNTSLAIPLRYRPGSLAWLTAKAFTLEEATNNLTGAKAEDLINPAITPKELRIGGDYTAGDWVYTPIIGSGPETADPYYHYTDVRAGATLKFAYVEADFTLSSTDNTIKDQFDSLVEAGTLTEIVVHNGDGGIPISSYRPRFQTGDYLEYRGVSGDPPEFFIATKPFTPSSNEVSDLLEEGVVIQVAKETAEYERFVQGVKSGELTSPHRMFSFFKGDQTLFRDADKIHVFVARENVTPLFDFSVYLANGVFEPISDSDPPSTEYVPFFQTSAQTRIEDLIVDENGKKFYRVIRAFSPTPEVIGPSGTSTTNRVEVEEFAGNLLRIVRRFDSSDRILSRMGEVSSLKLGVAEITIGSDSGRGLTQTYLWGNTDLITVEPELFWKGGDKPRTMEYGDGTLAL